MKNIGKTLVDKILSLPSKLHSMKKLIYVPIAAAGITLSSPSLYAQTRESLAAEYFTNNSITASYLKEDATKWDITGDKLQAKNFDEDWGDTDTNWGYTRFSLIDASTLVRVAEQNVSLEADINVSAWAGPSEAGFSFGDPTMLKNGTYYRITINAHPDATKAKVWMGVISPGSSYMYFNSLTDILTQGTKNFKMKFSHDSNGYHLFIDEKTGQGYKELEAASTTEMNKRLRPMEGYPILTILDATYDPHTAATVSFDDIVLEADAPSGGSATPQRIRKSINSQNALGEGREITPKEIPHRFSRADSNMDNRHDVADAINTLSYLFLGNGNVRCPDAADVNDDGRIDVADVIMSLNSLFINPEIRIPAPNTIEKDGKLIGDAAEGIDTTPDKLSSCEGYSDK